MPTTYLTVAIPYVNARPHLGYAYELVLADLCATARRARGDDVRFLGGTDDNSLKNVLAADAAGVPVKAFVAENAAAFSTLAVDLGVRFDDYIHTGTDPRHRPAVHWLWDRVRRAGDLYQDVYRGRYCIGCEDFVDDALGDDGRCSEHGTVAEVVDEPNWFFRLSRHAAAIHALIADDVVRVRPLAFRGEVLSFIEAGLRDISVSRSVHRARGWGIPVPGDPNQVIYVWFDALTCYLSALGLGSDDETDLQRWWGGADERVHVIGKGILRFHAVYWLAFLLSAGLALPTEIRVHPHLTVDGQKLSKSGGATFDPASAREAATRDGLRWWFARAVAETADTDVSADRIVSEVEGDLANTVGNTVHRVAALVRRVAPAGGGRADVFGGERRDGQDGAALPAAVVAGLSDFEPRRAAALILDVTRKINREIDRAEPWTWSPDRFRGGEGAELLRRWVAGLNEVGAAVALISPEVGRRIDEHLATAAEGQRGAAVFPRLC